MGMMIGPMGGGKLSAEQFDTQFTGLVVSGSSHSWTTKPLEKDKNYILYVYTGCHSGILTLSGITTKELYHKKDSTNFNAENAWYTWEMWIFEALADGSIKIDVAYGGSQGTKRYYDRYVLISLNY